MANMTDEISKKLDEIAEHFGFSRIIIIGCTETFSQVTRIHRNIDNMQAMSILHIESKRLINDYMTPIPPIKLVKGA